MRAILLAAAAGYKTIVREVDEAILTKGLGRIEKFLAAGVEKGKVTAGDSTRTLANLSGTASLAEFRRRYPDATLPPELRKLEP